MMKISIALATFNGEKYLLKQLESYLNQTELPDELVVSDDNSSDKTIDILKEFRERAPFTVKIRKNDKNLGFTKNFERAISMTSGDLIFLSDQDDVWFSNKIESIKKAFLSNPEMWLIINDQEIVKENLESTGLTRLDQIKRMGHSSLYFKTGCCTTIKSELKKYILPIPAQYVTYDVWIHLLSYYLEKRYVFPKVLQLFRRHEENASVGESKKLEPINYFSSYLNYLRRSFKFLNSRKSLYKNKSKLLSEIVDRLNNQNIEETNKRKNIISSLSNEINSLENRYDLNNYGFFKKRLLMINMLLKGNYRHFEGIKSFIKDFILSN